MSILRASEIKNSRKYALISICCYVLSLFFIISAPAQIIAPSAERKILAGAVKIGLSEVAAGEFIAPSEQSPEMSATPIVAQILPSDTAAENYSPLFSNKQKFIDSRILRPNFSPPKQQKAEPSLSSAAVFIPKFFDAHERLPRPDLSGISRLRFLTAEDFFPFNYRDSQGNLSGYNIDLARALCAELRAENICRIEAAPWEVLTAKLQSGQADAVISGLAPTAENRLYLNFSRAYMRFPARFLARANSDIIKNSAIFLQYGGSFAEFLAEQGTHLKIGIIKNTAHEKMLKVYFSANAANEKMQYGGSSPRIIAFTSQAEMINALQEGNINLAFGDGLRFAMLLNAQKNTPSALNSDSPAPARTSPSLTFIGDAYYGSNFLGQGMRIAVMQNNTKLAAALDYALWQLERKGKLAELYLRRFPVGFY